jgi:hypothetical protein
LFLLNPNETRIVQPAVPSWFPFRQAGAGVVKAGDRIRLKSQFTHKYLEPWHFFDSHEDI